MWPRRTHRESPSGSGHNAWLDQRDTTMQRYQYSGTNHSENAIHHNVSDYYYVSSYHGRSHLSMNRKSLCYDSREPHYSRVTEPPYSGDRDSHYSNDRVPHYSNNRVPRYSDDRVPRYSDDRVPRYSDDRVPRYSDRVPRYSDDRVPRYSDDRVPRYSDDRVPHNSNDRVPHYTNTSLSGTNQGEQRNISCYPSRPSENLEPQWSSSYCYTERSGRMVTLTHSTNEQTGAPGFEFSNYRRYIDGKNSSNGNTLFYPSRRPRTFPYDCGSTEDSIPSTSSSTTVVRTVYIQKDTLTGNADPDEKTIPWTAVKDVVKQYNKKTEQKSIACNLKTALASEATSSTAPSNDLPLPTLDISTAQECSRITSKPSALNNLPKPETTPSQPVTVVTNELSDNEGVASQAQSSRSAPTQQRRYLPSDIVLIEQRGNPPAHSALNEQHGNPPSHSTPNEHHGNPPAHSAPNVQHGNPPAHSAPNKLHGNPPSHSALREQHGHTAQKIESVADIEAWLKHRLKEVLGANPKQDLNTAQSGEKPCQLTAEQTPSSTVDDSPPYADIQSKSRCVIKEQNIKAVTPVAIVSPLEPQRHPGPVGLGGRDDDHTKCAPKLQSMESSTGNDRGKSPVLSGNSPGAFMDSADRCSRTELRNELAKQEMTIKGQVNNRPHTSSNEEYCDIVVERVTESLKSGTAVSVFGMAPVIHYTLTALRDLVYSLEKTVNFLEHKDDTIRSIIQNCWGGDLEKCEAFNCKDYPQVMKDVAAACAKTKDNCPAVINTLLGMSVEELVATYPKLSQKNCQEKEEQKSLRLNTNEKVDDMDKEPGLALGLNSFPKEEITHIDAKEVEIEETSNGLVKIFDLKTLECLPVPDRKEMNVLVGFQTDTETLSMKYSSSSSSESSFKVTILSAEEAKKYFELPQKNASPLTELSAPIPEIQNNIAVTPSENKGQEKETASMTETTVPHQDEPSPLFVKLEKPSLENTDRGNLEQACCCPGIVVNDRGLESRNCPYCNKKSKITYIMSSMFKGLNSDPVQIPVSQVFSLSNDSVCSDAGNTEEVNDKPIRVELRCLKYEDITDEEDPWHDDVTVDNGPIYEDVTPVEDTLSEDEDEAEDEDWMVLCLIPACLTFEPVEVTPVKPLHLQSEQKDEHAGNSACYRTSVLSPNLANNEEEPLLDQTTASTSPHTKGIEFLPKLKNEQAIEASMLLTKSGAIGKQCKEQRPKLSKKGELIFDSEHKSNNKIQRRANSIAGVEENSDFSISSAKNPTTVSRDIQQHAKKEKRARKWKRIQSVSESEDIDSTPEKQKKIKLSTGTEDCSEGSNKTKPKSNHSKLKRAKHSKRRVPSEFESNAESAHFSIREPYSPQKRQKLSSDESIYEHKKSFEEVRNQCKKEAFKAPKDLRLVCGMETEDSSDDDVFLQDYSMDKNKKCNVPPVCTSSPTQSLTHPMNSARKQSVVSDIDTEDSSDDFVVPQHHYVGKKGSRSPPIPPFIKPTEFQTNLLKLSVKSSILNVSKKKKNGALEHTDVLPETPKVQTVTESSKSKALIVSFNRESPNRSMVEKEALFNKHEKKLKGEGNRKEVRKETDKMERKKEEEKRKYYKCEKKGDQKYETIVQKERMRGEKNIDKNQSSNAKTNIALSKYGDCNIKTDSDTKSKSHLSKLNNTKVNKESTSIISLSSSKTSTMVTFPTSSKASSSSASPFSSKASTSREPPSSSKASTSREHPSSSKASTSREHPISSKASTSREPPSFKASTSSEPPFSSKASSSREPPSFKASTSRDPPSSSKASTSREFSTSSSEASESIPTVRHDGTSARQHVNSHWAPSFFPTRRDRRLSSGSGQRASPQSTPDNNTQPRETQPGNHRPKGRPGLTTSLMKKSKDQAFMLRKSIHRDIPIEPRPVGEGYKWADKRRPSQTKVPTERQ